MWRVQRTARFFPSGSDPIEDFEISGRRGSYTPHQGYNVYKERRDAPPNVSWARAHVRIYFGPYGGYNTYTRKSEIAS